MAGRVSAQRRQQAEQADQVTLAAGIGLAQHLGKLRPQRVFGDLRWVLNSASELPASSASASCASAIAYNDFLVI